MIKIQKSPTADTRTCNVSTVTMEELRNSSRQHILDVSTGMHFLASWLVNIGRLHDHDKLTNLNHFYEDFQNNFETTGWWDNHRKVNRHHLNTSDGVPMNVNLMDVLEYITDCVMAGLARRGEVYDVNIDKEVLMRAFDNTVELLKENIQVVSSDN